MAFVQLMQFRTSSFEEVLELDRQWEAATEGKRTLQRALIARDRNDPERYAILAFFESYESAMVNSELPETQEFATRWTEVADDLTFTDFDIVEERS